MRQGGRVSVDLSAAADFLAGSARVLDRRRFDLLFGNGDAGAALAAVDGYRNPDGGYGWGLEPDLRSRTSQPGGALHAFEAFADVVPVRTVRAAELCDWLASVSLPDRGLPFALPVPDPAACAPFWASAASTQSSLQITAVVLGALARQRDEGGGWYGELSLAQTAHWLLDAPAEQPEPSVDVDPAPYLLELPTSEGVTTVVAPPGSPAWAAAAVLPPDAQAVWCAKVDG